MNYLNSNDSKLLEDITNRKEFYQFFKYPDVVKNLLTDGKFSLEDLQEEDLHLEPQSYQSMVANFLNPYTPYARLLLKWDPGMGKTIASLIIAMMFIKIYQKETTLENQEIGSVFVIGFTEEIFKKELLRYPEFGFINREEIKQLEILTENARNENKTDVEKLQEFQIKLKKRLTSRTKNGFFRFFGYKAFVNRIFLLENFKKNINDLNEQEIRQALKDGSLKWNVPLLESFKNSLIICDEIHNVYNSLEKNNWGVALQMVLDQEKTCKALFMSATPINNNPTEIIDLANLLQTDKLSKDEFFDNKHLKKGALEKLEKVFKGKVSFIQDTDPSHFASQQIVGEVIPGIDYLKFIRCPMSDFHYKTYEKVYEGVLAQDAQYLMDIAFPNPNDPDIGLFRTNEIKRALSFAPEAWQKKYGFKIDNEIISGFGLNENEIGKWSGKYAKLIKDLKADLIPGSGKTLIYHDVVHISGVLFIEQLLLQNGFIGIDQSETPGTLCSECGKTKQEHITGGNYTRFKVRSPDAEQLKEIKKDDPFIEPNICNTKVAIDNKSHQISGYIILNEYQSECEFLIKGDKDAIEYLLEFHTPAKILTTKVDDDTLYKTLLVLGFRVYETDNDIKFMVYENIKKIDFNPVRGAGFYEESLEEALEKLQNYETKLLNPYLEKYLTNPIEPDDVVVFLMQKSGELEATAIFQRFQKGYNLVSIEFLGQHSEEFIENAINLLVAKLPDSVIYGAMQRLTDNDPIPTDKLLRTVSGGANGQNGKSTEPHEFIPARYIVAHSDMEKSLMFKHIERFNSLDNTWGQKCKIIIGSKIIKESYNFKAIRKVKVTARPANIATLIQILGRARRKKAHINLPPEARNIEVNIYTTCLPIKEKGIYKLSHEEQKYLEKIEDYKIIQLLEKIMHQEAIDGITARDIILPGLGKKQSNLGALWFEPNQPKRSFKLKDLNLTTFDIFHAQDEISTLIYMIKRLYVEKSYAFTFDQLWETIKNPPFKMELNTDLFQKEHFVIALSMLIFGNKNYVRPLTTGVETKYLLDILHSDIDKRIMQPDKSVGFIHHIGKWYIFIPLRNGQHDKSVESTFRPFELLTRKPINILRYVKESTLVVNYENQKLKFRHLYEKIPIERLAASIGKFGVSFHRTFVEEVIKYVFTIWTNPSITAKSELHEFYYKFLYFYDLMGLIVWAANAKEFMREQYKEYILPVKITTIQENRELSSSISKSSDSAHSIQVSKLEFSNALKHSIQIMSDRAKTLKSGKPKAEIVRTDPKLLPIGHFMAKAPRFYHPDKDWFDSPEYVQRTHEIKENDIIIGYYEKSGNELNIKFKIRPPIHKIQKHKDTRMVEKGSMCSSNSKDYLLDIAKKLKIPLGDKINVPNLCHEIETKLQLNELEERKKKSNIKWFYSFWEERLDERVQVSTSFSSSL